MIWLLLVAFGLTCATVLIHALGTLNAMAHFARIWREREPRWKRWTSETLLVRVVSVLLLLHLAETGVWAATYCLLGLLSDFETALYFSITSYTTVGYGDVVLPAPWRLLGPFEGAVGILMFGWSTGVMATVISRLHAGRLRSSEPPAAGSDGREPE